MAAAPGRRRRARRRAARTCSTREPGDAYRFNWNTPILLSPHNPDIVWLGGNRLFRSYDQGNHWVASADLTKHVDRCDVTLMGAPGTAAQLSKNDGVTSFSTITAISESPVMPGVVWAGTDDGNLQVSTDNGVTFTEVGKNISGLPAGALTGANPYWISRIDASHFEAGGAYVAIDGHRADDLKPYVFVTHDYGRTWSSASGNLPVSGNVQVVREDPKNRNLLYAGTEFGMFVSLDAGKSWEKFMTGYPTVRTDDILVHPRDGDLIVASHGRSIWIADDITPLQQLDAGGGGAGRGAVRRCDPRSRTGTISTTTSTWAATSSSRARTRRAARRSTSISSRRVPGDAKVSVLDAAGKALCETNVAATAGIHRVQWTLVTPLANAGGRGGRGGATGGGGGPRQAAPRQDRARARRAEEGGAAAAPVRSREATPSSSSVGGRDYTKSVQVLEDRWAHEGEE